MQSNMQTLRYIASDAPRCLRIAGVIVLLILAAAVSGCGGGGGGNAAPSSTPSAIVVSGTVTDSSGNIVSGTKVAVQSPSVTTTTQPNGSFSVSLPYSTLGSTVTFDYYNLTGSLVYLQQVAVTGSSGTQSLGTVQLPAGSPSHPAV
jgi:hypothetical protein